MWRLAMILVLLSGIVFVPVAHVAAQDDPKTFVTFWFDGGEMVLDQYYPLLERRGWPAVVAPVADHDAAFLKQLKPLSAVQLIQLEQSGWEVSSQTLSYPYNLNVQAGEVLTQEIAGSQSYLLSQGVTQVPSFTFPGGQNGGAQGQEIISSHYSYWLSGVQGVNEIPGWRNLLSINLVPELSMEAIFEILSQPGWVVFRVENFANPLNPSRLEQVLDLIEKMGLEVVTPQQVYSQYGYAEGETPETQIFESFNLAPRISIAELLMSTSRIVIPEIEVDRHLGIDLEEGFSWDGPEERAMVLSQPDLVIPGFIGVTLIAGHRQWGPVHGVFSRVDELEAGDEIQIIGTSTFTYEVVEVLDIDPSFVYDNVYRVMGEYDETVILLTCSPWGETWRRLMIIAERVS